MGFFKKTKGSIISDAFQLVDDHANLPKGLMYDVSLYEDYLTIKECFGKQEATLNYEQITDVFYGMETEITEKNKSVGLSGVRSFCKALYNPQKMCYTIKKAD